MPKIWYHFFDERPSFENEIIEALSRSGISLTGTDVNDPNIPGIIIVDKMSENVLHFLRNLRHGLRKIMVIATSAHTSADGGVWDLLQAGASDVLVWDKTRDSPVEVSLKLERWAAIERLTASPAVQNNLIGPSIKWQSILRQIVEIAHFTDVPVLITGESGTGKELVARLIHTLDGRNNKGHLVVLDCTTVVPELSGSEFFGHERGAFTGAVSARDGAFALADGGSLFLDEVGELSLRLQAELLRVVQEKSYKRVGSNIWRNTRFRLICATNRDLLDEQEGGRFRSDFYHRIACWTCKLPPLCDRPEDILPLARHFIQEFSGEKEPPEIDDSVSQYLQCRSYPGNVRDLKHLIYRIMCRHVGPGPITAGDIPDNERPSSPHVRKFQHDELFEVAVRRALLAGAGLKEIGRTAEDMAIRIAVNDENGKGKLQRAAQRLGVTVRALEIRRASRQEAFSEGQHPDKFGEA